MCQVLPTKCYCDRRDRTVITGGIIVQKTFGFAGKILGVNLTTGDIWTELTEKYAEKFLGGRGIGDWLLYNEVKPWVTPFDPQNRLIFDTGPLVGTLAPCSTRHSIEAKSPMTGGVGSANAGGHFSPELKFAGYDHIVIQGRSRKPVTLWINDGQVELVDASHIWGKTTWDTDDQIKRDVGDDTIQVVCIGPAGENWVRSAAIIANRARAAARCSLAAVMGAKNLKAVAVKGTGLLRIAEPKPFMAAVDHAWEKILKSPVAEGLIGFGTYFMAPTANSLGFLPFRNFQDAYMDPGKIEKLAPEVFRDEYETGRIACFSCPLACSHFYGVEHGPFAGLKCEGFEANDAWNWMARFDIDYPPAMIKLHGLCNELGLDEDNASLVIGWAFEAYQRGILSTKDTDGLKLEWGDYRVVAELLRKLAYRQGLGDLLAEGVKRASEIVGKGSERFAIHVKGQDSVEPMRALKAYTLGCCVSPRGGTHTRGAPMVEMMPDITDEFAQKTWGAPAPTGPFSYENKVEPVVYFERLHAIFDCMNICNIASMWGSLDLLNPDDIANLYSAATGKHMTGNEMMMIGERIHNIEKAFNTLHTGFSRKDDYPPQRFMEEPIASGPAKGERLTKEKWDKMLDRYYELHGWDKETGWQTRKCLEELDLGDIADDLERVGRLPR